MLHHASTIHRTWRSALPDRADLSRGATLAAIAEETLAVREMSLSKTRFDVWTTTEFGTKDAARRYLLYGVAKRIQSKGGRYFKIQKEEFQSTQHSAAYTTAPSQLWGRNSYENITNYFSVSMRIAIVKDEAEDTFDIESIFQSTEDLVGDDQADHRNKVIESTRDDFTKEALSIYGNKKRLDEMAHKSKSLATLRAILDHSQTSEETKSYIYVYKGDIALLLKPDETRRRKELLKELKPPM